ARELQHQRVGALGKRELLEELIRSETRLRARDAEETAVVVEVLPYRQRPVERVRLRDDADLPLDLGGLTANIETGDERPPARREHRGRACRSSSTCRPRSGR